MKKGIKAFLFIIAVFFLFLSGMLLIQATTGKLFNTMDYYFHFYKSKGLCYTENYSLDACSSYPPLLSFISSPFSGSPLLFLIFNMAIFLIFIPSIIYFKTKNLWSLLIYYSSAFVFNVLYAGIFAQALLTLLIVLILREDKIVLADLIYLTIGEITHSKAFLVLMPLLFYKYFRNKFKDNNFFPFVFLKESYFDLHFAIKLMPIINYFYIIYMPISQSILILYYLVASAVIDYRASLFIPVLLAYFIPPLLRNKDRNFKGFLIIIYIAFFIMSFILCFRDIYLSNLAN